MNIENSFPRTISTGTKMSMLTTRQLEFTHTLFTKVFSENAGFLHCLIASEPYPEIPVQTNVESWKAVHVQIYGNKDNHHRDITVINWLINLIRKVNGGF